MLYDAPALTALSNHSHFVPTRCSLFLCCFLIAGVITRSTRFGPSRRQRLSATIATLTTPFRPLSQGSRRSWTDIRPFNLRRFLFLKRFFSFFRRPRRPPTDE